LEEVSASWCMLGVHVLANTLCSSDAERRAAEAGDAFE